jgi:hypothetical protein
MKQKAPAIFAALLVWTQAASAASCSYTLSPGSATPPCTGSSSNFTVSTGASCAWSSATTNSWIHPFGSGTGSGAVAYTVDANSGTPRTGAITAGGKTFTVTQAGAPLPLGVGLNNTNLIWTTSETYPWFTTNPPAPTFDGVNSVVSGNRFVSNSVSWLQTTVTGPGTLSFWWKVDSDVTPPPPDPPYSYDYLEFLLDGASQDQIMGQIDWNYRTYYIPAGTHVLQWQYVKDPQYNQGSDQGWLDEVSYTTNAPIALQEALNTCGVTWTTGGNTNPTVWSGQTNTTHDGKSAAKSGSIYLGQESWLQTSVSGITNLSFWWQVSSQTNYDFLEFYTNNILAKRISGEVAWQSNFFKLPATTNLLKWRYVKTNLNFVAQGQDSGWVDQVGFSPNNFKAGQYSLQPLSTLSDGRAVITVQGESGCNCQVQVSSDLVHWSALSNFTTSPGGTSSIVDAAAPNYPARFYRAYSP